MWKVMLVHPEIMDSEQPTWEILKLIIQAQYSITALGIIVLIAIAAIIIGVNWIGTQRKVKKITSGLQAKLNNITEELQKTKEEMTIELQLLRGETYRIIVNLLYRDKNWERMVVWAGCAIEEFGKTNQIDKVNFMTNKLIYSLKKSKIIIKQDKNNLLERINFIPDKLKAKIEEIKGLINILTEKEDEEET